MFIVDSLCWFHIICWSIWGEPMNESLLLLANSLQLRSDLFRCPTWNPFNFRTFLSRCFSNMSFQIHLRNPVVFPISEDFHQNHPWISWKSHISQMFASRVPRIFQDFPWKSPRKSQEIPPFLHPKMAPKRPRNPLLRRHGRRLGQRGGLRSSGQVGLQRAAKGEEWGNLSIL